MTYLTAIALMIFMVSPLLVPLVVTAAHAIANWRRTSEPLRPVINPERRVAA
jgi:hypothetical protein